MERTKKELEGIRVDLVEHDSDFVAVVEGHEGVGKTSLGIQLCKIIDPKFSVDAIILNKNQLKDNIRESYKGKAILLDEGSLLLYRRNAMIKDQREILQIFQVCRKYNLFIVICIPSITALDKYLVDYRIKALFKVTKRGRFFAFSKKQIKRIRKSRFSEKLFYPRPIYIESYSSAKKVYPELWESYLEKTKEVLNRERFKGEDSTIRKIISTNTAKKVLGCHIDTVHNYIKRGLLETTRFKSGRIGIYEDSLGNVLKSP